MKALFSFILVCLSTVSFSQKIIEFIGVQEEPIFKSKEDSVSYANLQNILGKSVIDPKAPRKLDSLFVLRMRLVSADKILGFRKIYRANPDFFQYENLSDHTDFAQVKELSLSGKKYKKLPAKVFKCKNLEVLQVVNTSLSRMPRKLNRLSPLKTIMRHLLSAESNQKICR